MEAFEEDYQCVGGSGSSFGVRKDLGFGIRFGGWNLGLRIFEVLGFAGTWGWKAFKISIIVVNIFVIEKITHFYLHLF